MMTRHKNDHTAYGFTLIELLVVIAILAVLAVVVVLTLNPAGLLQESRDANRLQDMATLNSAISYSLADNAAESLGSANTVYVSVADPVATSTAGDQCQGIGLLSLPSSYSYHCAASSTWRKTDGTGWIPVSLSNNTFGSSLSQLPVDPVNATSSRLYYSYATDANGKFEVTTPFESAKYRLGGSNDQVSGDGGVLASLYEKGSKLGLEPLDYGDSSLVGYWSFNEGNGSTTYDYSGSNATGSWNGTATGTAGYYSAGKIGPWAGAFDGTSTYVYASASSLQHPQTQLTWVAWFDANSLPSLAGVMSQTGSGSPVDFVIYGQGQGNIMRYEMGPSSHSGTFDVYSSNNSIATSTWYQVVMAYNGTTMTGYLNGVAVGSTTPGGNGFSSAEALYIGTYAGSYFSGLIDDVRIYNRALSAAEIAALYNGGK